MQDLNVTLIQVDQVWEDKLANFSKYEAFFSQLNETDLVILPEMFHTGFSMSVDVLAEEWEDSEGLDFLKNWSSKLDCAFYTSLIIQEEQKFFNRGVFVSPDGKVNYYDKRKSFGLGGEDKFYTAGAKEVIVDWKGWKINLQICYDLRFPELIRNRLIDTNPAYDVLVYVANWPEKRIAHWETLLNARAIENQCYVLGVNRVGIDGKDLVYNGGSKAITSLGETKGAFSQNQEGFIQVNLDKTVLENTRLQLPFLKDI
jgi:predicted amidohydrolase